MFKAFSMVLVLSLLVLGFASSAFATTSRVIALAETGDYINDDSNIFRWYGVLPSYANLVMAEAGTWNGFNVDSQALGITHACGENGKWGTFAMFLLKDTVDEGFFINTPIHFGTDGFFEEGLAIPVNKFVLMWGKELEALSLGFSFTRSDASTEDETITPASKTSRSYTTFGGGVRADIGDAAYTDIAVTVGLAGYEQEGGLLAQKIQLDKKMTLDFAGRMFYEWKENATIVPVVEYFQYEYALDTAVDPHGGKVTYFSAGMGMNMDINTNNLLICGAQVWRYKWQWSSSGDSNEEQVLFSLPTFFLALESDVKPWLTVRIGAWKALIKQTDTFDDLSVPPVGQDVIVTYADFEWFLGLGLHVAEFDIDMLLGEETPFNMGYWLTGYSNYESAPVSRISAIYHF